MSQKMISRRGALSLLGLTAALGFAVPTTALTTSNAQAQAQPTAPTPQAQPSGPTSTAPAMSGMERRQQRPARQSAREMRREARRTARSMRREARQTAREMRREARQTSRRLRREARRGNGQLYMNAGGATKQK